MIPTVLNCLSLLPILAAYLLYLLNHNRRTDACSTVLPVAAGEDGVLTPESVLSATTAALDAANVSYFLIPDAAIWDEKVRNDGRVPTGHILGKKMGGLRAQLFDAIRMSPESVRFSRWARGCTVGVPNADALDVLLALVSLPPVETSAGFARLAYVESHAGIRVHSGVGGEHGRWDYAEPYVDLVWFQLVAGQLKSGCCDCGDMAIGGCSKRMCGCKECTYEVDDVFPRKWVHVQGVAHKVAVPGQL